MLRISALQRRLLFAAVVLAAACGSAPRSRKEASVPTLRLGADRAASSYAERHPKAKARLLARLNGERRAAGVPPVAYDLLAASVGDAFCLDTARTRSSGHWDTAGRPPYLRWGLAGGVDYHAENVSSLTRIGADVEEAEVPALLLDAHERMMAERPPADGHRRTVLEPEWTHVGFGAAVVGGEFRMTEEFSRHVVEWVEVPAEPLPAGARAPFAVKLPAGWALASIEVGFEAPASPMSRAEIARRTAYTYPGASQTFLARAPAPSQYPDGSRGEIDLVRGVARANIPLLSGAGNYYVFVYAASGSVGRHPLAPLTSV
ncbi:MAG: CAP domain-containing protein, partial [Thermoanaerobaculia bacterium]